MKKPAGPVAWAAKRPEAFGFVLIFFVTFLYQDKKVKKEKKLLFTLLFSLNLKMTATVPGKNNILTDTHGLVAGGGNSSRMGTDKSMLQYYEKPQRYHVYNMLLSFCEKVFISCNKQQTATIEAGYNFIQDDETFGNIGPMAALLTAFTQYPKNNLLLIGCDYPFLTATALQGFAAICKDTAAGFFNAEAGVYEPLLAWYPYTCFDELKRMYEAKQFSLQHFLKASQAIKYLPPDGNYIKSIDTPEAFTETYKLINAE